MRTRRRGNDAPSPVVGTGGNGGDRLLRAGAASGLPTLPEASKAAAPAATPKPAVLLGRAEIVADGRGHFVFTGRVNGRPLCHARRHRRDPGGAARVRRAGGRADRPAGRLHGQGLDRRRRRRGRARPPLQEIEVGDIRVTDVDALVLSDEPARHQSAGNELPWPPQGLCHRERAPCPQPVNQRDATEIFLRCTAREIGRCLADRRTRLASSAAFDFIAVCMRSAAPRRIIRTITPPLSSFSTSESWPSTRATAALRAASARLLSATQGPLAPPGGSAHLHLQAGGLEVDAANVDLHVDRQIAHLRVGGEGGKAHHGAQIVRAAGQLRIFALDLREPARPRLPPPCRATRARRRRPARARCPFLPPPISARQASSICLYSKDLARGPRKPRPCRT